MVCVTALYNVAVQIGTTRIMMAGSKFHYPMGRPDMEPELEKAWRLKQVRAALSLLTKPVNEVTVFMQDQLFN